MILRDFEAATFFARAIAHANIPAHPGVLLYNFRARPLPIFIIWPKYATCVILRDSEVATFFTRVIVHSNIPGHPGVLLYNFHARPRPIFIIWPKYATPKISRDSEVATFLARASRTLISQPTRECSF